MISVAALKARNAARWQHLRIRADRVADSMAAAERLSAPDAKARYQGVSDRLAELAMSDNTICAVPWWFVAIVSEREYGGPPHWDRQLGQGDPLHQVSQNEPAGRGPFLEHAGDVTPGHDAWTRCCLDALVDCAPHAARWTDWSVGGALTLLEQYNGLGYAARGLPSPYLWSGTDQYKSGKFVRDGVFDPDVVDSQLGCAGLLRAMMALDPSIAFDDVRIAPAKRVTRAPVVRPPAKPFATSPPPKPSITTPAQGSIGAFFVDLFKAIFRRK